MLQRRPWSAWTPSVCIVFNSLRHTVILWRGRKATKSPNSFHMCYFQVYIPCVQLFLFTTLWDTLAVIFWITFKTHIFLTVKKQPKNTKMVDKPAPVEQHMPTCHPAQIWKVVCLKTSLRREKGQISPSFIHPCSSCNPSLLSEGGCQITLPFLVRRADRLTRRWEGHSEKKRSWLKHQLCGKSSEWEQNRHQTT